MPLEFRGVCEASATRFESTDVKPIDAMHTAHVTIESVSFVERFRTEWTTHSTYVFAIVLW